MLLGSSLAVLSACATDPSAQRAVAEVASVTARLDQATEAGQVNARELAAMESRVRALEAQVARDDRDLRRSAVEIDRLRVEVARLESASRGASATVATASPTRATPAAAGTLSAAPAPAPPPAPVAAASARSTPPTLLAATPVRPTPPDPRASTPAGPPPPAPLAAAPARPAPPAPLAATPAATPSAQAMSADAAFASGLASFRAGEHGQAVLELTDFVARHPDHPQAAAAQWWIGEAYYRQRDWRQALVEFQRVADAYAKSPQVADALLRIALCHESLGDAARSRAILERVVREYPASAAAPRARTLLAGRGVARTAR